MNTPTPPNSSVTELFDRFATAFVSGDTASLALCLSADFVWCLPSGETVAGRDAALAAITARLARPGKPRFADSHFEFYGDTVVQSYRVTITDANGADLTLAGMDVYRISNGLISRKDAYWKQIPATPVAP